MFKIGEIRGGLEMKKDIWCGIMTIQNQSNSGDVDAKRLICDIVKYRDKIMNDNCAYIFSRLSE